MSAQASPEPEEDAYEHKKRKYKGLPQAIRNPAVLAFDEHILVVGGCGDGRILCEKPEDDKWEFIGNLPDNFRPRFHAVVAIPTVAENIWTVLSCGGSNDKGKDKRHMAWLSYDEEKNTVKPLSLETKAHHKKIGCSPTLRFIQETGHVMAVDTENGVLHFIDPGDRNIFQSIIEPSLKDLGKYTCPALVPVNEKKNEYVYIVFGTNQKAVTFRLALSAESGRYSIQTEDYSDPIPAQVSSFAWVHIPGLRKLIILGGYHQQRRETFDDVWVYDLRKKAWRKSYYVLEGKRDLASAVFVRRTKERSVRLIGGVDDEGDMRANVWKIPTRDILSTKEPPNRAHQIKVPHHETKEQNEFSSDEGLYQELCVELDDCMYLMKRVKFRKRVQMEADEMMYYLTVARKFRLHFSWEEDEPEIDQDELDDFSLLAHHKMRYMCPIGHETAKMFARREIRPCTLCDRLMNPLYVCESCQTKTRICKDCIAACQERGMKCVELKRCQQREVVSMMRKYPHLPDVMDAVTGLQNEDALNELLDEALEAPDCSTYTLYLISLHPFDDIMEDNEELADNILRFMAYVLTKLSNKEEKDWPETNHGNDGTNRIVRVYPPFKSASDEFAVVAKDSNKKFMSDALCKEVFAMAQHFKEHEITLTIGIAKNCYEEHFDSAEEWIEDCDVALCKNSKIDDNPTRCVVWNHYIEQTDGEGKECEPLHIVMQRQQRKGFWYKEANNDGHT